jgi:drug/metabolite transporter (DMT)-like permease
VIGFSGTPPATRVVVAACGPVAAWLGRVALAGAVAGAILLVRRQRMPTRAQWRRLVVVAAGVVLGFPILSAVALRELPSAHAALLLGLTPLATSLVGRARGGERPSPAFWLAAASGFGAIALYTVARGGGTFHAASAVMLGAVAAAAIGYSEGAVLAREIGGWRVICWALVAAAPAIVTLVFALAFALGPGGRAAMTGGCALARPPVVLGLGYLGLISMLLAFFAWYRGLAEGGIAKASQVQLAQMPLSLLWSALLLGERIGAPELLTAAAVVGSLVLVARSRVARPTAQVRS